MVVDLPDESRFLQTVNLFRYEFVPLMDKDSFIQLNGGKGQRDIKRVDHVTWIDSRHIFMAPSEDIQVALRAPDEPKGPLGC